MLRPAGTESAFVQPFLSQPAQTNRTWKARSSSKFSYKRRASFTKQTQPGWILPYLHSTSRKMWFTEMTNASKEMFPVMFVGTPMSHISERRTPAFFFFFCTPDQLWKKVWVNRHFQHCFIGLGNLFSQWNPIKHNWNLVSLIYHCNSCSSPSNKIKY